MRRVHCYKGYTTENDVVINDIAALEVNKFLNFINKNSINQFAK